MISMYINDVHQYTEKKSVFQWYHTIPRPEILAQTPIQREICVQRLGTRLGLMSLDGAIYSNTSGIFIGYPS